MLNVAGMRQLVADIEKVVSNYVGLKTQDIRKVGGDNLANELVMSVAALVAARAIVIVHVWTGDSVERVQKRFMEAMEANINPAKAKIMEHLAAQKQLDKEKGKST